MDKLNWSADFDIGIPEIDNQHKAFIEIINRLVEVDPLQQVGQLHSIINDLTDNITEHLAFEEKLLEDEGYPDLDHHRHEHAVASDEFRQMIQLAVDDRAQGLDKLVTLLQHWFEHHLLVDDMAYQQFLIRKGVIPIEND